MTAAPPLYYLGNARGDQQRQEMIALEAAGLCIFCPGSYSRADEREVLLEHPAGLSFRKQVLLENATWVLLRNEYPYEGTKPHLLLVPKEHVTMMHQLTRSSRNGYWDMLDRLVEVFGLDDYYGLGCRNGDMRYTAATIAHFHIHVLAVDPEYEGEAIKLYLSSRPADPPSA